MGYYNTGDRMMQLGGNGRIWGGMWGMLFGSAFFVIPGICPLLVAGPAVAWIVGALEGAAVVGGLSALGAGLAGVHDTAAQVVRAREIIGKRIARPFEPAPGGSRARGRKMALCHENCSTIDAITAQEEN